MQSERANTAILLFTHNAETEVSNKCFSPQSNRKTNKCIAESLIRYAESTIIKTKIPHFVIYTQNQSGNTFGERLTNAIQDVFDKGFEKVIVTGNDSPDLSADILKSTYELLKNNELVIGPTNKGGTYLIGVSRNTFDKRVFQELPWQTNQLLRGLIHYAQSYTHHFHITKTLVEINDAKDLFRYFKKHYKKQFSRWVSSLISIHEVNQLFFHLIKKKELIRYFFRLTSPPRLTY